MLVELDIRDLAVADHVRVSFAPGLNVITGETGAGKSIIVDALGLLLGGRADASDVRAGAGSARVEAVFHLLDGARSEELRVGLANAGVEPDSDTLIVSRELSVAERLRTTARINERAVLQSTLLSLGTRLVDIHSQTDHAALLRPAEHIRYLDRFAGTGEQRAAFAEATSRLQQLRVALSRIQSDERERTRRVDRLAYECSEIRAADLRSGEEEELRTEQQLLANAEQLVSLSESTYAVLQTGDRGGGAIDALGRAADLLSQLAGLDPRLAETALTSGALQEQAADLAREIRAYRDEVEYNPARLAAIGERITLLNALKRKYGATIAEVIAYGEAVAEELAECEGSDEQRERLQEEVRTLLIELGSTATALGQRREKAAKKLTTALESQLSDLHMAGARFAVSFTRRQATGGVPAALSLSMVIDGASVAHAPAEAVPMQFDGSGVDRIEFLVTLNRGEPLRPLARVASGGETSRLMLALKAVLGDADEVPVLVFDEIEAGLGGRSGGIVAEKLARLASQHQVICISHLPQVAARAQRHLNVTKNVTDGRTRIQVHELTGEARVQELAAMIGTVSAATLESARELLSANR